MKKALLILFFILDFILISNSALDLSDYKSKSIHVSVSGDYPASTIELDVYSTINDLFGMIDVSDYDISVYNPNTVLMDNDVIPLYLKSDKHKVSINAGTMEELSSLNGIGEKTALKIIEYRTLYGPFASLEEIMEVKGIGEKKYEGIKEQICL